MDSPAAWLSSYLTLQLLNSAAAALSSCYSTLCSRWTAQFTHFCGILELSDSIAAVACWRKKFFLQYSLLAFRLFFLYIQYVTIISTEYHMVCGTTSPPFSTANRFTPTFYVIGEKLFTFHSLFWTVCSSVLRMEVKYAPLHMRFTFYVWFTEVQFNTISVC